LSAICPAVAEKMKKGRIRRPADTVLRSGALKPSLGPRSKMSRIDSA
jgi:hypothetical protein